MLLLLAAAVVQPPGAQHRHDCRADEAAAGDKSVQEGPSSSSTATDGDTAGEVLIGYFGPNDPDHPEGGDMWCAAVLAIEQANRAGGFNGGPFRLIPGWSENPWGSGVKYVAEMAYKHKVCAIIGGIDGPSTHLAEQVVAKARLALMSGANADRTANLANVPWMFSTLPGHHLQAAAMAESIQSLVGQGRFIVVSAVDHDSHLLTVELKKCFRKKQVAPAYHFDFKGEQAGHSELVDRIMQGHAEAVVIVAPLTETARLCISLREMEFRGTIFGGPCVSLRRFVEIAGNAAEGAVLPVLYEPSDKADVFAEDLLDRFGKHSNYPAAHMYDTINLLLEAVRRAGLDRQRIRDEIEKLSPYAGVTGTISWDRQGSNTRKVLMGTIAKGHIEIPAGETTSLTP